MPHLLVGLSFAALIGLVGVACGDEPASVAAACVGQEDAAPVEVPDVVHVEMARAFTELRGAGFCVSIPLPWVFGSGQVSEVGGQNPVGGTSAPLGSAVALQPNDGPLGQLAPAAP